MNKNIVHIKSISDYFSNLYKYFEKCILLTIYIKPYKIFDITSF